MNNGVGLRVVLFVSACKHHCKFCHNQQTWNPCSGKPFDEVAKQQIFKYLSKDHIAGVTWSGGDPLHPFNVDTMTDLSIEIKRQFPNKTIWLYTGYKYDSIKELEILKYIDVLVDGKFEHELADVNCKWAGSSNQNVVDVQGSLKQNRVILYES